MSVLSRAKILEKLDAGEMVVSPILCPKQIGPSSVDLRVGTIARMVRARGLSHVDPRRYVQEDGDQAVSKHYVAELGQRQKLERHEIIFKQRLLLHPGTLALVPTLEWVKLPGSLQGVVTARSSWAREGLNIATASFINPGYQGIITLELTNLGQIPMAIYPGVRIAQMAFYTIEGHEKSPIIKSQFDMSFEPEAKLIGTGDECFLPHDIVRQHFDH